jgi:hypothetical protein
MAHCVIFVPCTPMGVPILFNFYQFNDLNLFINCASFAMEEYHQVNFEAWLNGGDYYDDDDNNNELFSFLCFLLKHNGKPNMTSRWHPQVKLIWPGPLALLALPSKGLVNTISHPSHFHTNFPYFRWDHKIKCLVAFEILWLNNFQVTFHLWEFQSFQISCSYNCLGYCRCNCEWNVI